MTVYKFDIIKSRVTENPSFYDATDNELRVFIALMERGGSASEEELCEVCGISAPRLNAALAFWYKSGVINPVQKESIGFYGNKITDEFQDRFIPMQIDEESAGEVAATIRNHRLADLFDELAAMMHKPMLTPLEIKRVSGAVSQYAISEEYLITLAAHLAEKEVLTISRLLTKATKLIGNDISSVEELNVYIADSEQSAAQFAEYRRVFGIYNRSLSKSEKNYLDKWSNKFAYGTEIVSLAYDISVAGSSKLSFAYIDKLLSDWHENGCKTVSECEKRTEALKIQREAAAAEKKKESAPQRRAKKEPGPRFGNFDPEEAMRRALERTYSSTSKDE